MAISEMSVLSVLALKSEQNGLLDVLSATGAAQVKKCSDYELAPLKGEDDETPDSPEDYLDSLKFLEFAYEELGDKKLPPVVKDGFGVDMKDFLAFGEKKDEVRKTVDEILSLSAKYGAAKAETAKLAESVAAYSEYECLEEKFSFYSDTKTAAVFLGTVPADKVQTIEAAVGEIECAGIEAKGGSGSKCVIAATCLKDDADGMNAILSRYAFSRCPFTDNATAAEKISGLNAKIAEKQDEIKEILRAAVAENGSTTDIKTYIDYLGFLGEKSEACAGCGETARTFLLEAYVPTEATERVAGAIKGGLSAAYVESKPVPRDEFAPTLMKNNKVIGDFEAVTNMYSAPAYGALDPNGVMAFFFSLFMGIIMGDAVYGLMMILGGFLLASKSRKGTSIYRMARVFAYGGFFAVGFGILFDSFSGLSILRKIPAYAEFYAAYVDPIEAKISLAGITVPSMLMWCLALGTFQIAVSLVMKAVQCFRRRQVVEGIFSGLVWAFALLGGIASAYMFIKGYAGTGYALCPTIALFGVGILTAGITEKGIGKVTKIFGSAYGLINYASDILSYARLYGLMLAGAQIASIFSSSIAVNMLFPKGVIGIIGGVAVIVVGNVFNLAMSLLGAFIHDSRLQYVEFFGRFYEGEGELFTPLGSQREYLYVK